MNIGPVTDSRTEPLTESQDPGAASSNTRDAIYAGSRLISVVEVNGNAP